jgi:K+-transporting ATPase KdpF subunit
VAVPEAGPVNVIDLVGGVVALLLALYLFWTLLRPEDF